MTRPIDFALRLRDCRRRAGLTQKQAAKRSKIGEKSISAMETGRKVHSLTMVQLLALLRVYQVGPEMFFAEDWSEWW